MQSQNKENKLLAKRLIASTCITILIHIMLLVFLVLILPEIIIEPMEEFIGPIYIELEDYPEIVPELEETVQETSVQEPVEHTTEQPAETSLPETTNTEIPGPDKAEVISPVENPDQTIPEENPAVESVEETEKEFTEETAEVKTEEPEQSALDTSNLSELDKILETQPDNTITQPDTKPGDSDIVITWEDAQSRVAVFQANPVLPDWVSTQGQSLRVVVSFTLVPQGFLINITLRESCGYTEVDTAVINAIRNWRYKAVNSTTNISGSVTYFINLQ